MKNKIKAGIIGGSGFTGLELVKILSRHKYVDISFATSRKYKNLSVCEVFPAFNDKKDKKITFIEEAKEGDLEGIDIMFLCLPPFESMEYLKGISGDFSFKVIDLGSDFRLKNPIDYKYWYGTEHIMKGMLSDFIYGLPEINKEKIESSDHVANPGCYPTSILLGLAPLMKNDIDIIDICIDSKSGISGAGRKLKDEYLFTSMDSNFYAYSTIGHRHIGEIEQELENISGKKFKISFTPHLLPVNRGIFTSIYCRVGDSVESNMEEKIYYLFEKFCKDLPFVKFTGTEMPQLKDAVGTNMCLVGFGFDARTGTLKIFSVLDNLLKGAAGQAVQNMNIMMDFEEKEGLDFNGIF
ncbi:MAG: N-acetyl-gamma-glutamyl-phosphate reductase [Actinomycetota bacterium]|nr:N-acetyl-gamma-glutamyl-phosphate reductase [Actinomycetota bacterium]